MQPVRMSQHRRRARDRATKTGPSLALPSSVVIAASIAFASGESVGSILTGVPGALEVIAKRLEVAVDLVACGFRLLLVVSDFVHLFRHGAVGLDLGRIGRGCLKFFW